MGELSDLEGRITAALNRISEGLETMGAREVVDPAQVAQLRTELDEERTANAQLEERVKAIKEKQEGTLASLTEEVERLRGLLETGEAGMTRLKRVNSELRSNNAALREAMAGGVAEPHLINKAMMAELEALRAAQAADRAELDAVLGELNPLVEAAQNAPAEEEGENA